MNFEKRFKEKIETNKFQASPLCMIEDVYMMQIEETVEHFLFSE